MNATRWRLAEALEALGRPVHAWSGGRTKWNRTAMGLDKTHTLDALSVGRLDHEDGDAIVRLPGQVLVAKATGRGSYARTTPDRFGFRGCGGPGRSSTSGTSPVISYAPPCPPVSGRARGRDVSPSGPEDSTASRHRVADSTSLTGICGSCSGATDTGTPPVRNSRHHLFEKPVEPHAIGS